MVGKGHLISGTHMVGTNKSLGQHWLKNRAILDEIADLAAGGNTADLGASVDSALTEVCVEIGPGLGFLTSSLLKRFNRVIAVEYDQRLAENLPKSFPGKNLEVITGDFLGVDLAKVTNGQKYVLAGNIPYYITSPIIEKALTEEHLPEVIVLLMQKEVAERIISDKETMLSLFVKNRAEVAAGPVVPRGEFTPPPKVDSQVLVLRPHQPEASEEVFKLIRQAFIAPRKKLIHNLAPVKPKNELETVFKELGFDLNVRPGDLHLGEYDKLFARLKLS